MARATRLAGSYDELSGEEPASASIERATRIDHDDGRVEIVINKTDPDYPWEARFTASPGSRTFRGFLTSPEWETRYEAKAELWVSPDADEILLLGTCWAEDEDEIAFQ